MTILKPTAIIKPFCTAGDKVLPSVGADSLKANQQTGFPVSQSTILPIGETVKRPEMNGVFNLYSQFILWLTSGGQSTFEQAVSDENGGYPINVILFDFASKKYVRSLHDNNTANFVVTPSLINGVDWEFFLLASDNTWTGANTFEDNLFFTGTAFGSGVLGETGLHLRSTVDTGLRIFYGNGFLGGAPIRGFNSTSEGFGLNFLGGGNGVFYEKNNSEIATLADIDEVRSLLFGIDQTWQNVTGSRSFGVQFINATEKPIALSVLCILPNSSSTALLLIDGAARALFANNGGAGTQITVFSVIEPNTSYEITGSNGAVLNLWTELRA
jgi:hypothetical protein